MNIKPVDLRQNKTLLTQTACFLFGRYAETDVSLQRQKT